MRVADQDVMVEQQEEDNNCCTGGQNKNRYKLVHTSNIAGAIDHIPGEGNHSLDYVA